jgi:peptide/nickel transport system ATP-binding protein
MSLLEISGLGLSYRLGREWRSALREVSLSLEPGEIRGVVGESGSGKSSLAYAIMGYLGPGARLEPGSQINYMGQKISGSPPAQMRPLWAKSLKIVPQNPGAALNPSMKIGRQVEEVLAYSTGQQGRAARQAVLDMFGRVQLSQAEQVAERYPHQISGGMQQRVLIAMALLTQPDLLILDEPTTGLDVTTEAAILDLIRELIAEQGTGVLYISHNLGVIAQLCQTVTVMYGGEVMVDGAVADIFRQPLHPYTIGLLNSLPRLGQTKTQAPLQSIEGHPPGLHKTAPRACVFAARCAFAIEKCQQEKPPLEQTDQNRAIRCHRWREIRDGQVDIGPRPEPHPSPDAARPAREGLLAIKNLSKHYPARPDLGQVLRRESPPPLRAVDGVNLSVQAGRTLGLVGESGSGKTSLARLLVGLNQRTGGEIDLGGVSITQLARARRPEVLAQLQMVFQNPQQSLNPYLSVGQALRRPLMKLRGLKRAAADEMARKLLAAVNLPPDYADRYPPALSGGEKQRVAIARAFASQPALIVADEPVSALDVSVQAAILNLLARLQEEQDTAYLFISHDLAVVGYLADYVAVMYLGQIVEVGYTWEVFGPPLHPYTEALLSALPDPDPQQAGGRILLPEAPAQSDYQGCRFHPRCPYKLGPVCEQEAPPWQEEGQGHFIRCHIPIDELTARQGGR